jgi:nicotinamidase-related amidase
MLRQIKVDTILVAGLTTPVSVATTVRDAVLRDFRGIVVEDGCASFETKQHRSALAEMASLASLMTCEQIIDSIH